MEYKVVVLSQKVCPNCDAQKGFMNAALKGQPVEYVVKEEDEMLFNAYLRASYSKVTPTTILMKGEEVADVIYGFKSADIMSMYNKYIK